MSWTDLAFYADWSGLRPMSEMEYEKMCRGTRTAIPREKAWGTIDVKTTPYVMVNQGTDQEYVSNPAEGSMGNEIYEGTRPEGQDNVFDCGWAAALFDSPSRAEAGASYFGVMNLSDNVIEAAVYLGNPEGRVMDSAEHGDGFVGPSPVESWPAYIDFGPESIAKGLGGKGGGIFFQDFFSPVSSRELIGEGAAIYKFNTAGIGGRFVRSQFLSQ